jgi:hypothetical protein
MPPAPDVAAAHPEQGPRHADALPAHFNKAQAEQALWQEFCDYDISINNTLTEALRIHMGPSIWLFEVSVLRSTRGLFLIFFMFECFLILLSPCVLNCCSQELEGQAWARYDRLTQLSTELYW